MATKRQSKSLVRKQEIIPLLIFVFSAFLLLAFTGGITILTKMVQETSASVTKVIFPPKKKTASFKKNQDVQIKVSSNSSLAKYGGWIGKIKQVHYLKEKNTYRYDVIFENKKVLKKMKASVIQAKEKAKYQVGEIIQLKKSAETDLDGASLSDYKGTAGKVDNISLNYRSQDGGYKYDITFDDGIKYTNIHERDLSTIYQVKLSADNSASQNNEVLRQAFAYAKDNPGTVLGLPSGEFKIGSQTPEQDYQLLSSDTELRGNKTTLLVEGTAYWFGLATGPGAEDGVKNFTMRNIDVKASDLTKGDHFMIMANHGTNWKIINNSFTMVHKSGSHIFDLGSVQNSVFNGNQFVGYAPDLTNKTNVAEGDDLHLYYAEAIQLDAAENTGMWDANLIKNIDPNYAANNAQRHLSSNIVITNNAFLPYKDSSGKIIAYSASIGQHSSDVGLVSIYNNTFTSSLVKQIAKNDWVLKPIHLQSDYANAIYANTIN